MNFKALHKISYGLYVICSKDKGNAVNGQIADALFQVTSDPARIAVSINKKNLTHEYIEKSGVLTVSILNKETPLKLIGVFGFRCGRDIDKLKNVNFMVAETGVPILADFSTAFIEVEIEDKIDVDTHTLFIGRVVNADVLSDDEPMTYEYYHQVKGGFSSRNAPTFNAELDKITSKSLKKEVKIMDRYVCKVCGYVYDPMKGDPENGIEPGTSFNDLPESWVCPVCGAGKEDFEKKK